MYAHQVLDDLKIDSNIFAEHIKDNQHFENLIRCAQHFNLGKIYSMKPVFDSMVGKKCFLGELGDVRLPFFSCWVDWNVEHGRQGMSLFEVAPDIIRLIPFMTHAGGWMYCHSHLLIRIGKHFDGKYAGSEQQTNYVKHVSIGYGNEYKKIVKVEGNDQLLFGLCERYMTVANAFLLLLQCKNVGTFKHEPQTKVNNYRIQKGRKPLFTFHTLIIKPTRKSETHSSMALWNNRIHLQRGHFKTFTQDKPLFGKLYGRYWWQSSVRGKSKKGIIIKDYAIKTDQFVLK